MMYLISQLWVWLLLALIVGLVVGWMTCSREPTRWWVGWVPWGTAAFLIGLILAVLRVLPDRPGYLLDSALLMFGAYIIGCCVGCLIKQWLGRNETVVATAGHGTVQRTASVVPAKPAAPPPAAPPSAAAPPAKPVAPPPAPPPPPVVVAPPPAAPPKPAAPPPVVAAPTPPAPPKPVAPPAEPATAPPPSPRPVAATTPIAATASTPKPPRPPAEPDLPPEPAIDVPDGLPGRRPRGYATPLDGKADDLKRIRGIGRQNEGRLHALGIWHFSQIAEWVREEIDWVGSYLAFPGRIDREQWISQAKVLATGGETEFSQRVAKGEVSTSRDAGNSGQDNVADLAGITNANPKPKA